MSKIHRDNLVVYEKIKWIFVIKVHDNLQIPHIEVVSMYPSPFLMDDTTYTQ